MSYYEPQTAKKVYLYRNGTINADAKLMVVNGRQVRDFSTFLNRVTSGIRAPVAVRNIYTPMHGHKIHSLEELESGRYYVAGGSEQFKKVKYGSGPKLLPRRQQHRVEVSPPTFPASHHVIVAESRYKRPVEKPFVIHVFRNGDELFHGVRVLLPKRVMASWDHVLETVTEKADLITPAKKLCTLDGEVVTQLQDGGKYVAVEGTRPFRRVAYCATNIITAARRKRTSTLTTTFPEVTRRVPRLRGVGRPRPSLPPLSLSNTAPPPRPQPPPVDPTATLLVPPWRKVRPMAGRRNKEARERALLENRDDSVFGGSPVMQRRPRMPSPPPSASITNILIRENQQYNRESETTELPTTEEVPEEEGVAAERSEVKEEADEPEMKLQEEEVELVSQAPTTNIDLTMSRKQQQEEPIITTNDRGEENLPLQTNENASGLETDGKEGERRSETGLREDIAQDDDLTPPTRNSQATPPAPPTNDNEDEHVLIVEDPPQ